MSTITAVSYEAYVKIREFTHMTDEWTSILNSGDWDTKIDHWVMNTIHPHHSLKQWFDEEFCMNKILRQTKEIPDLETHIVSMFTIDNKIFCVSYFPIPKAQSDVNNDCEATVVFYGGPGIGKVIEFFNTGKNFERLVSIRPC